MNVKRLREVLPPLRWFLLAAFLGLGIALGTSAKAEIYNNKQVSYTAVGDGSFTITIGAPVADDCNPAGYATTTWVSYGITGGGGTFWTIPTPAEATSTFYAMPVANTDFTSLQERCSVRIEGTNYLYWPYQSDLTRIGFPMFHTGEGSTGASWNSTVAGGGFLSGFSTTCHQANDGFGCRAGSSGGNVGSFWMTFATTTAEIADSITLTIPGASECGSGAGVDEIDVYVMKRAMRGNENANYTEYDDSSNNNWSSGNGTGGSDRVGTKVASFFCQTTTQEITLDMTVTDAKTELGNHGTLGFYKGTGGTYSLWYAGSTLTAGGTTLDWLAEAQNDFVLLQVAGQTGANYIDGWFSSTTAIVTPLDLGITSSTLALCSNISTTSTNIFSQLGSDLSWGVCNAFAFLFVPSVSSMTQFQSLKTTMDTKFPFSTIGSVQGVLGNLQASSTNNFPEWSLSLGTSGTSTTSTTMTAANLIPKWTFFSTSTVSGYLVNSNLFQTLKTLMGYSLILGAVYIVYKRSIHLFGSAHQ